MWRYIIFRLLYAVLIVVAVFVLVFLLTHWVTSPVDQLLPLSADQATRVALEQELGLDKPIYEQLFIYAGQVVRGDFGESWWRHEATLKVVMHRLPATLELVSVAFILAMFFGVLLGILASLKPRSFLDKALSTGSLVGICLPNFWVGLILIIIFSVKLGWFPTSGMGDWKNLVLPAVTLAILPMGRMVEIVRSAMLDQLREQYVVTARAKGVKEWLVVVKHALKNAGITITTMGGWELGRMIAGYTVAVEIVFAWPGIGSLVVDAITHGDFPLVQTLAIVIAIMISLLNLCVDLTYPLFDPRIKYE